VNAAAVDVDPGASGGIVDVDATLRPADFDVRGGLLRWERWSHRCRGALVASGQKDYRQNGLSQSSHDPVSLNKDAAGSESTTIAGSNYLGARVAKGAPNHDRAGSE
jgi:hypothetical protein